MKSDRNKHLHVNLVLENGAEIDNVTRMSFPIGEKILLVLAGRPPAHKQLQWTSSEDPVLGILEADDGRSAVIDVVAVGRSRIMIGYDHRASVATLAAKKGRASFGTKRERRFIVLAELTIDATGRKQATHLDVKVGAPERQ